MKKTYVTTVPNHIGAFLSASRLLAALDVNITRVSYNKAVDSHTIFIEAEGSRQQLAQADEQLAAIGYLRSGGAEKSVVLLEFQLRDVPGGARRKTAQTISCSRWACSWRILRVSTPSCVRQGLFAPCA